MKATLHISQQSSSEFLGTRFVAKPLREQLENLLAKVDEVNLDFSGLQVTQSFIDEMLGVLVLKHGPVLVKHLVFTHCSDDVKAIINFVINSRLKDYKIYNKHKSHNDHPRKFADGLA